MHKPVQGFTQHHFSARSDAGFTLIELLIVIGIVGILAATVTFVINPVELLRRARDGTRIQDLQTVDSALNLYELDEGTTVGSPNTVYISIPDTSATCANLSLPSLLVGWSYACVTEAGLRNTNGTGWIPVPFNTISQGSPLSKLPIDPVNSDSDNLYYAYVTGGSWAVSANLESLQSNTGYYTFKIEKGTDLTLGEGITNALANLEDRILLSNTAWNCYGTQGTPPPFHICDAGAVKTLMQNGYGLGGNSLKYELSSGNRAAVLWGSVPYINNEYYKYGAYVKACPGDNEKIVKMHRYTPNSSLGTISEGTNCTLSENDWTFCTHTWQGRTGDTASTIYIFIVSDPVCFEFAYPSVERRTSL